ncbi:13636_t:CDS:1, partial [Racocetra fulgida]
MEAEKAELKSQINQFQQMTTQANVPKSDNVPSTTEIAPSTPPPTLPQINITKPPTPSQPTRPTTPSQPTRPTTPSQPAKPSTPSQPTKPSTPSQPTKPSTPSQPTPSQPTKPSTPSQPTPSQPTPSQPTSTALTIISPPINVPVNVTETKEISQPSNSADANDGTTAAATSPTSKQVAVSVPPTTAVTPNVPKEKPPVKLQRNRVPLTMPQSPKITPVQA